MKEAVVLLAAYLIGGIPFGFLIGKMRGVDVRTVGSKNIGATNVFRTVGKKWGLLAFFLDFLKGFLPTLAAKMLVSSRMMGYNELGQPVYWSSEYPEWLPLAVGIVCVVGHMLTPYMKFKGGKGVATAFGMLVALVPALVGIAFLLFAVVFALSHYISLGSCVAALFLAVSVWICRFVVPDGWNARVDTPTAVAITAIALFVVWKHRANIQRLIKGCENKIYLFGSRNGPETRNP